MGSRIDYDTMITGGVYWERMLQKSYQDFPDVSTSEERQTAVAVAESLKEKLKGVTVTMSPEAVTFMAGIQERKEAAKAEEERIRGENSFLNPENAFDRVGT